jgi:hypothetical protein
MTAHTTFFLTPWSNVLQELINSPYVMHEHLIFITVFTWATTGPYPGPEPNESILPYPIPFRSILMLTTHSHIFSKVFHVQDFLTKILYALPAHSIRATRHCISPTTEQVTAVGNASDSYSGGASLESLSGHQIHLKCSLFSSVI